MMSDNTKGIIEAQLQSGEDLLWAHVISHEDMQDVPPAARATVNVLFRILYFGITVHGVLQLLKATPEQMEQIIKIYLPVILGVALFQWILTKTDFGKNLRTQTTRSIYQNAIITDQRILLFNHNSSKQRSFTKSDISDSQMDYENGGLALRFSPQGNEKDSLLIGAVDFKAALNIIKSHFLKTGPSS